MVAVIDVSANAVASGAMYAALRAFRAATRVLVQEFEAAGGSSGSKAPRAGLVTFDASVSFHDLSSSRVGCVCVMGDVDDAFAPLVLDQWCVELSNPTARARLEALIDALASAPTPTLTRALSNQAAAGAAVKAAVDGLADSGGRVTLFLSSPITVGEGALPPREGPKVYGSDREKELFLPAAAGGNLTEGAAFWGDLGRAAVARGVCVDIAALSGAWLDLGSVAQLAATTGGEVRYYPEFLPPPAAAPAPLLSQGAAAVLPSATVAQHVLERVMLDVREG